MKNWIVRIGTLLVFNIAVLLLIVLLVPGVRGAWGVLWGAVILTLAPLWIKPLLTKWFARSSATRADQFSKFGLKSLSALYVFLVAFIVWILTIFFSQLHVSGWFWGYILPPIALLIAWLIYDSVDEKLEAQASRLYDSATGKNQSADAAATAPDAPAVPAPPVAPRVVQDDGLTAEQRKMLDDLG